MNQPLPTSRVTDGLAGSPYSAGEGGFAHDPTRPQLFKEFLCGDEAVAMVDEIGQQVEDLGLYLAHHRLTGRCPKVGSTVAA